MYSRVLIDIVKLAILEELQGKKLIDKEALIAKYPELLEERATFVTLNKKRNLRGCIGSIIAYRSLIDDLIENAKASAFRDPRFPPLTEDEFKELEIEISILTPPKRVDYTTTEDLKSKIEPFVDGVILKLGSFQATFLPSVWEQLGSFEIFFSHLCQKATLEPNCLERHPQIFKYQAKKIKEK